MAARSRLERMVRRTWPTPADGPMSHAATPSAETWKWSNCANGWRITDSMTFEPRVCRTVEVSDGANNPMATKTRKVKRTPVRRLLDRVVRSLCRRIVDEAVEKGYADFRAPNWNPDAHVEINVDHQRATSRRGCGSLSRNAIATPKREESSRVARVSNGTGRCGMKAPNGADERPAPARKD